MRNEYGKTGLLLTALALISFSACGGGFPDSAAGRGGEKSEQSVTHDADAGATSDASDEPDASSRTPCERYAYVISKSWEEQSASFKLFCGERLDYAEEGEVFELLVPRDGGEAMPENNVDEEIDAGVFAAKDITGDGVPDVVLVDHHYGTCCGPTYHVISLGEQVTKTATVQDYPRGAEWKFTDLDGDGIYEAVGYDSTFTRSEGVLTSFPALPVTLTFREGKYRLAASLMRKPAPSREEFMKRVREVQAQSEESENHSLVSWRFMADLTYSGNGHLAKKFAYLINSEDPSNDGRPQWTEGKLEWMEFLNMLRGSQYWADLAAMNGFEDDKYDDLPCPY